MEGLVNTFSSLTYDECLLTDLIYDFYGGKMPNVLPIQKHVDLRGTYKCIHASISLLLAAVVHHRVSKEAQCGQSSCLVVCFLSSFGPPYKRRGQKQKCYLVLPPKTAGIDFSSI